MKIGQVDTLLIIQGLDPDLTEELTSLAKKTGAQVEFVAEDNHTLRQFDGIAALLRFKI
ncbi:MAG: hypothetical protein WBB37_07925 [bacterium]